MFVKFKFLFFTKWPAPDSELSICLINLAFSNQHDLPKIKSIHIKHFMHFTIYI